MTHIAPFSLSAGCVSILFAASPVLAQSPPDYGIDFVTVGAPGNAAFNTPNWDEWPNSPSLGHGAVDYDYRIGRYEISTAQYLEFANTFYGVPRAQLPAFMNPYGPTHWGAVNDPNYQGQGFRWVLGNNPDAAMQPVFGISWRDAALYCNWLSNGKSGDPASLLTGAYDVSTWGNLPGGVISDDPNHLPGAPFWIPTFDEQLKAFHYDPSRYGPGQGGWWLDKNMSDDPGVPGPPGMGTTSASWDPGPDFDARDLPLGAYTDSVSPWGLFDTSGGASEWNETQFPEGAPPRARGVFGAGAGYWGVLQEDSIYDSRGMHPDTLDTLSGFRIASSVPEVPTCACMVGLMLCGGRRKREAP